MSEMYYRNYCVIVYGPQKNYVEIIKGVADGDLEILKGGEFLSITAMSTSADLNDIETELRYNNISFAMFEMDPKTSRAYTVDEIYNERLFDKFYYNNFSDISEGEYIDYEDEDFDKLNIDDEKHSTIYLNDLLTKLNKSIDDEDYELSAKLRDEIKLIDLDFYKKHVSEGPDN